MRLPPPVFVLRDVVKRYDTVRALGPVSLEIAAGRTTVLIGPSGCGKSTLLRLLAGLVHADEGSVRFGEQVVDGAIGTALRRRLGFVVQGGGLFPHLDAERNVTLLARHLGWENRRIHGRIRELLELARLPADVLRRYPAELSGGQRQRLSLMRALMLDPEVLLLDEPLGALDPITRFELQTDLRRVFAELGKTVVLVTHDLGEAAWFAQHLVLLRDGRILQQGTLDSLIETPADRFVTRFVNAQRSPLEGLPERSS